MKTTVHTAKTPVAEQGDGLAVRHGFRQELSDLIKTMLLFSAVSGVGVIIAMSVHHYAS